MTGDAERGSTRRLIPAVLFVTLAAGTLSVRAHIPRSSSSGDPFSPLYARRLEVGIINMDPPAGLLIAGGRPYARRDPVVTPLSGNPISFCLGSACAGSFCGGSACLSSKCFGSACFNSGCGGSACVVSLCGGSACASSVCGGSACLGSVCGGSICAGSVCAGSACGPGCMRGDSGDPAILS